MKLEKKRDPIYIGIATIPPRRKFFEEKVLPSLVNQASGVFVYHDQSRRFPDCPEYDNVSRVYSGIVDSLGDAGKFRGFEVAQLVGAEDFYYFTCDDDLVYPPDYCRRMIDWIEFFEREAVVSLHGSSFRTFPIQSYYRDRITFFCLRTVKAPQRVLFPGTGCAAWHSSTLQPTTKDFKTRNMGDIWLGLILQANKVPAVVVPHTGTYLTYNENLPIEETIWGQEHKNDFVQTALINQFSASPGFRNFQIEAPLEGPDRVLPSPLSRAPSAALLP